MVTLILFGVIVVLAAHAGLVHAQGPSLIPAEQLGGCNFTTGDLGFDCIPLYMSYVIRLAFGFAAGICLTQIMQAGYEYGLSGLPAGIVDKEAAKKRVTYAIIGLVVVILSYLIIDTLVSAVFLG